MDIEPNIEDIQKYNKNMRNQLLLETDKYVLPDFPITPDNLIIIKDYRQKLRDFTKNNYELPERPEFI
jgi:hypothetical protein